MKHCSMRLSRQLPTPVFVSHVRVVHHPGAYTPLEAAGILMAMFGAQSIMLTGRQALLCARGGTEGGIHLDPIKWLLFS